MIFLKLLLFPDSDLCYVIVTFLQILLTQATPFLISGKKSRQVLFMGLFASSYVIAGAISAAIIKIYTYNTVLALTGSSLIHLVILIFLSLTIREMCLKSQKDDSDKSWWKSGLIPVFFYCSFSFIAFFPNTIYDNPDNIPKKIPINDYELTLVIANLFENAIHCVKDYAKEKKIH